MDKNKPGVCSLVWCLFISRESRIRNKLKQKKEDIQAGTKKSLRGKTLKFQNFFSRNYAGKL